MKIERISFRKLITTGNFSNKALEATAAVEDGETPEQALDHLTLWVEAQLGGWKSVAGLRAARLEAIHEAEWANSQKARAEAKVEELRREIERVQKTVQNGLAPAPLLEIPVGASETPEPQGESIF